MIIILLDQKITIKWGKLNKKYYVGKGYVFTKFGDKFLVDVNDLPSNSSQTVKVLCDCCKSEIETKYGRYNKIVSEKGSYYCRHCTQQRSLSVRQDKIYSDFIDFCNNNDYVPVTKKEEITSNLGNVTYICKEHGERTITIKGMQRGDRCYLCTRSLTQEHWDSNKSERINELYKKVLNKCNELGYLILSSVDDINGYSDYIDYICPNHGEKRIKIGNLLHGEQCNECAKIHTREKLKLTKEEVISRIHQCGGEILNPDDYINQSTKNLLITCIYCGNPFTTLLQSFTQHYGQKCEDCSSKISIGELKVKQYLESRNINYESQKWFSDCRDIHPLPFDFYLPDRNTFIEFDGKQHFDDTHFFNYDFNKNKLHDNIKDEYCKNNDYTLIRIPYWEINKIDDILDVELNK